MRDWKNQMDQLKNMADEIRKKAYQQGNTSSWSDLETLFEDDLWNKINDLSQWIPPSNHQKSVPNKSNIDKLKPSKTSHAAWPKIDAYITPQEVIVRCALPGLHRSSLQMSLVGEQSLEIEGCIRNNPFADEVERSFLEEQFHGKFSRIIDLPVAVIKRGASHKWNDGILDIRLIRRTSHPKPEKIRL
jgi:HSP20 family molecular chaperone IbpA